MIKQIKTYFTEAGIFIMMLLFLAYPPLVTKAIVNSALHTVSESDVVESESLIDEQNYEIEDSISSNEVSKNDIIEEETVKIYREGYINKKTNIKMFPITSSESIGTLKLNTYIQYQEYKYDDEWVIVELSETQFGYVENKYISEEEIIIEETKVSKKIETTDTYVSSGTGLTKSKGINYGPSGKETYYNLDMSGVVNTMRRMGNNDEFWIREDGAKMLGQYVMVAADLNEHPRGSIVETSLGQGIVCDTGGFAHNGSGVSIDIATSW